MRRVLFFPLILPLMASLGCGGNNATVSGKVIYKGRPVTSGSVVIRNPDNTATRGPIQPDGTYAVSGVARGRVQIGVLSADPSQGPIEERARAQGWFPLPRKLGKPGASGLECEVTTSRFQHDIDIK